MRRSNMNHLDRTRLACTAVLALLALAAPDALAGRGGSFARIRSAT
jgi:hypothetical protein